MGKSKLNDKQRAFCEEYIIDLNATQAAIRAGYSAKTADVKGSQLLGIVKVRAYIDHLKEERSNKTGATAEYVLKWQKMIIETDFTDILNHTTNTTIQYKDIKALPKEIRLCIKQIKMGANGLEVTFYDKQKAHEMIAKHIGFYEEHNRQKSESKSLIIEFTNKPEDIDGQA